MKILVLSKVVPDTASPRTLDAVNGLLERASLEAVPDEINERTLEHALRYRDSGADVEIGVLNVGPAVQEASVRKFLAMGADAAVVVSDEALAGADAVQTAQVLAQGIRRVAPDLVLAGNESTDGRAGMVPAMVAEHLGWPVLPALTEIEISESSVSGVLSSDGETLALRSDLPAIATVTERSAEPRYPNFKGIMQARKKPLEVLSLADLGAVELPLAASVMVSARERPPRAAGLKIVDDGTAAQQLADFLVTNRML